MRFFINSLSMNYFKECRKITKYDRFDGQVEIDFPDEDCLNTIHVIITPTQGLHKGAKYTFIINFKHDYPIITTEERIYHPNIVPSEVCLNIREIWEENNNLDLESVITAIFWLLENPNFNDPVNEIGDEENFEYDLNRAIHGYMENYDKCINE